MPDLNQFKAQAYSLIRENKFLILSVISFLVVLVFSIALSNSIKHVESLENKVKNGVRRWKKKSMFGDLNKTEKICNWYGYKAIKAAGTDLVHWDFKRMNIVENMIKIMKMVLDTNISNTPCILILNSKVYFFE